MLGVRRETSQATSIMEPGVAPDRFRSERGIYNDARVSNRDGTASAAAEIKNIKWRRGHPVGRHRGRLNK